MLRFSIVKIGKRFLPPSYTRTINGGLRRRRRLTLTTTLFARRADDFKNSLLCGRLGRHLLLLLPRTEFYVSTLLFGCWLHGDVVRFDAMLWFVAISMQQRSLHSGHTVHGGDGLWIRRGEITKTRCTTSIATTTTTTTAPNRTEPCSADYLQRVCLPMI